MDVFGPLQTVALERVHVCFCAPISDHIAPLGSSRQDLGLFSQTLLIKGNEIDTPMGKLERSSLEKPFNLLEVNTNPML